MHYSRIISSATGLYSKAIHFGIIRFLALLIAYTGLTNPAWAQPTVSGNLISWPDDGWYQVQDASTYLEVCAGGQQCQVAPGTYIVINHSTGNRWESIEVEGAPDTTTDSSNPPTTVTVEGTTIRWPDDGWYQVQAADTYASVCEGGSSCNVPIGTYIVINHSTGQRFNNVSVGSSTPPSSTDMDEPDSDQPFDSRTMSWSIDGTTLDISATGWFQVQKRRQATAYVFYDTVCEGVTVCELDEGNYQIINHSSGEIWQNVIVGQAAVWWRQSSMFEGEIRWRDILYNNQSAELFNVYMNGVLVTTTSGDAATVNNFLRGTNYRIAVYALEPDGSERLVGARDIQTDGPPALVPYGRPAEPVDSFGFEMWDGIPDDRLNLFPSDCLFAIHPPASLSYQRYCFSPATRYLMNVFTQGTDISRSIQFEFPLPGENSTNHLEALAVVHTASLRRGPGNTLVLVADTTTTFADSQYEISVFRGNGRFLGTYPILQNIRYSSDTGIERQINLDGTDLRVTMGPTRPIDDPSPFVTNLPRRLHVAGEYYEPGSSGVSTDLSGWTRRGAFLAIVDSETGETVSQTFYPGMRMSDVPVDAE